MPESLPEITQKLRDDLHFLYVRFPHGRGRCQAMSGRVASQLGLGYVEGEFLLDHPLPGRRSTREDHAWNEAANGVIVDLTAEQFNQGLDNPAEHTSGLAIIERGDPRYRRYVR